MSYTTYTTELVKRQLMELSRTPPEGIFVGPKDDDLYTWEVTMSGPVGTPYEGGLFKAELHFTPEFPNKPPQMKFVSEMWHPNGEFLVYNDGKVCISILHDAGVDRYNAQETADERWRPILGVEQILISVMSMLSEPNADSPANVDAAKMYRENEKEFRRKVRRTVERTLE